MNEELVQIKAKRTNIYLMFLFAMIFLFTGFYLANSMMVRYEASLEEFKPLAKNFNAALGVSGEGVKDLSQSGVKVLDALSKEIPNIENNVKHSTDTLKNGYKEVELQLSNEYRDAKKGVLNDYRDFKVELKSYKNKIDNDIVWLKSEIESWRYLIILISSLFGLIMVLISVKDILENIRWLLTFTGLFKAKETQQ